MALHLRTRDVQTLLDAVCAYLPSPVDTDSITGKNPMMQIRVVFRPSPDEPLSALAFKIATDPCMGRLCFSVFIRERLKRALMFIILARVRKSVFHAFFQMHSNKQNSKEFIGTGDIGAGRV